MRLVFLTHEPFYPPSGGGSSEAVYLVQELVRRGHQVHLFCPKLDTPEAVARQFGVELHEFKTWQMGRYTALRNFKYLLYPFFLQRMVETSARSVQFDLVLAQHAIAAVTAGRLKQVLRVPVVMNFLDYLTGFMETWPRYLAPRRFIKALERYELSLPLRYRVDGILTVSDPLADYFAGAGYPRAQILPIYFGYDAGLFPFSEPDAGLESPVVVMHGSFDRHHLGPIALEAVAHVVRAKPEVTFRFVGKQTPALTRFRQQIQALVPEARMECVGFVPYGEAARHLASATVGMVPYEESTGTHCAFVAKTVEYLGVGRPVVSTPLASTKRYFGDEPAVRFSQFNGVSFGEQILSWLRESLERRRSVGLAASRRVQGELDWRVISKKAVDFVERIQQPQGRT